MNDLLSRLQRTKMLLVSLIFVVAGAALIALGQLTPGWNVWRWIQLVPYAEVGGILIGAGILSVWLDHFFRREQDLSDDLRLRRILHEQAPAMRDAVLQGFAADTADLKRVATPQLLDSLITNGLALRLDDPEFAQEIYADIHDQAVLASERWHDATLSVELSPLPAGRGSGKARTPKSHRRGTSSDDFFTVTVRWEYTTMPRYAQRRFVAVSDRDEYSDLMNERGAVSAWYMKPAAGIDPSDRESFELLRFTVNGEERPIRRSSRKTSQTYTVAIGDEHLKAGEPVTISYTYQLIMRRDGNLLFFDIEEPTRNLSVDFDYSGCDLAAVSTLDLVPSVRPTRIENPAEGTPGDTIRVHLDGWIFPRSGVAFVWTAQNASGPKRPRPAKPPKS